MDPAEQDPAVGRYVEEDEVARERRDEPLVPGPCEGENRRRSGLHPASPELLARAVPGDLVGAAALVTLEEDPADVFVGDRVATRGDPRVVDEVSSVVDRLADRKLDPGPAADAMCDREVPAVRRPSRQSRRPREAPVARPLRSAPPQACRSCPCTSPAEPGFGEERRSGSDAAAGAGSPSGRRRRSRECGPEGAPWNGSPGCRPGPRRAPEAFPLFERCRRSSGRRARSAPT